MSVSPLATIRSEVRESAGSPPDKRLLNGIDWFMAGLLVPLVALANGARAQVNVVTAHNDAGRTGQNLQETILTPSNVNSAQFGKLFIQPVNGVIYAQPLYVSNVAIPGRGVHNVVYVATTGNYLNGTSAVSNTGGVVYAFDADSNGGTNSSPLWQTSLLPPNTPSGQVPYQFGVVGTPVIDLSTNTMYLVDALVQNSVYAHRLHALDITTGAEKLGGPILVRGSVPGTGSGSVYGVLTFNDQVQLQRPGLLLLNGVVYVGFGAVNDEGSWHGWIFSYNAATLQQINVFCTSPNGSGGGIWMGGAALAAEVNDPAKPYGRMFIATGNGDYGIYPPTVPGEPYSNPLNNYGMSVLDLDLTGGIMTVEDVFTPYNEASLDQSDGDLGAGAPVLLPTQTLPSGHILNPLVQIGKSGAIYILDRDNLGGFNIAADQVVEEVQTPESGAEGWGAGVWGTEAYWNNIIYSGGANSVPNTPGNNLAAYSFVNGTLSTAPVSQSAQIYNYPGPTPSISANGAKNGILWALNSAGPPVALAAYDATNLGNALYSSSNNSRDTGSGTPVEFAVPTIANGKVYVPAYGALNVYGLLTMPTAPPPTISPASGIYAGSSMVSIVDTITGATIYYTTDGSTPTSSSAVYQNPFPMFPNETVTAIASATGYLQSAPSSATYASPNIPSNPVLSMAGGTYSGTQTLKITDSTPGATIYYTIDGPVPNAASPAYVQPLSIPVSETVTAIAIGSSGLASSPVSATYTIRTIDYSQGFTLAPGAIRFNGSTGLDDFRLQLTDGGPFEAGSAFYATPVNIQSFTTDFTFQLSNPLADGMTFTIQSVGPTALGGWGGYLGYGFPNSVAIKFDLFDNEGEGPDSTGMYIDGALPTVPAIDLSSTGINLHSGDYINAHIAYDGSHMVLTLIDAITLASWSNAFPINVPSIVGGNMAYVGFTAGSGAESSSQKITSWTYLAGPPVPDYSGGFTAGSLTLNGAAALSGTRLRLTDGGGSEVSSAFFTSPVNVQSFTTSFSFQLTNAAADGITFTIQGAGPTALGGWGGYLGYGISNSVAIKFDLFDNQGEGPDSTGMYTYGALPTMPAIDLSSAGIDLHSGDTFNALLTYDGATLTERITDTITGASAVQTYSVDIQSVVGGATAYVGFTGGTGGETAIQDILSWSYSGGAVN